MARKAVIIYRKNKRKSHPHSKNASVGQTGYKKKYRGQGRWKNLKHQVRQVQEEGVEVVYVKMKPIQWSAVKVK